MKSLMKFIRDEEGLTTVEYAIAGGLVGAGVIAAFHLLGEEVARVISESVTRFDASRSPNAVSGGGDSPPPLFFQHQSRHNTMSAPSFVVAVPLLAILAVATASDLRTDASRTA